MKLEILPKLKILPLVISGVIISGNSQAAEIEEIVVTATKRATSLQDTPMSISALSGETLEKLGVNDFADFVGSVPGLSQRDNGPGQSRPVIRGIQGAGEAQVGVYLDEIPVSGAPGATNDAGRFSPELKAFDMERIEVLKGPQGTLYGSGSMGGTIRLIANKPDPSEFSAKIFTEVSSTEGGDLNSQINLMANLPLIEDTLAIRAVLYDRKEDGFIDNISYNKENINDVDATGGRVIAGWNVSDATSITATYIKQDQEVGGGFHINTDLDDLETGIASREEFLDDQEIWNLVIDHKLSWADLLYSYSNYNRQAEFNFNAGGFNAVVSQPQDSEVETHELRLTGELESISWTAGLFSQERDSFVDSATVFVDPATGIMFPLGTGATVLRRDVEAFLDQQAMFGEMTFHLADQWDLTLGGRYFDIENGSAQTPRVAIFAVQLPPEDQITAVTKADETGSTYKANLSYNVNDDVMVYGTWSEGFRPGGTNQAIIPEIPTNYDSDTVENWELGIHSQWLDRRLTLNAAAYLLSWDDIQVLQTETLTVNGQTATFQFTGNGAEAEVKGLEMELNANVTDNLSVNAGINWVKAELSADSPLNLNTANQSQTGLDGDDIPNVPDFTFNFGLDYYWNVSDSLEGVFHANYDYVGESFSDFNEFLIDGATGNEGGTPNISYQEQGRFGIWDIRVGLETEAWKVFFFVDNVFDKRGVSQVTVDAFRPDPGYSYIERPRKVGLSVSYEF